MEFRDLKKQYSKLKPQINDAVTAVFENANFISGKEVTLFEEALAKYTGSKYCITCGNGTDALELMLHAWGIGKGDAIFVPNFTFFATAETVASVGATPIFVDVRKDTFNIDLTSLETAIDRVIQLDGYKPRGVIAVDLFGQPAEYEELQLLCDKHDLLLFEDAAQGFGGSINGKKACSFGDAAITSFFPAKPLGCYGDGGAIFTNDADKAALLRSLAVHGKGTHKYDNIRIGRNSRLDTIQAAILNIKLKAFEDYELNDVVDAANYYTKALDSLATLPIVLNGYESSWAQYTIQLANEETRNALSEYLKLNGIPTIVYYSKTMKDQTAFSEIADIQQDCPVSSGLVKTVLSLPIGPYIDKTELEHVCNCIQEFFAGKRVS